MASQGPLWAGQVNDWNAGDPYGHAWYNAYTAAPDVTSIVGAPDTNGSYSYYGSDTLQTTGHGFSIPTGSIINGVVVSVSCFYNLGSANDVSAKLSLIPNSVSPSVNHALGVSLPGPMNQSLTTYGSLTYGSPTDTWGLALDPAAVNSPNFGFQWQCNGSTYGKGGTNPTASYVDAIGITVYYASAAPPPSTSTRNRIMV